MFKGSSNRVDQFGESLPQQINRHIFRKIIEGELKAGDKIVEEEIARELNTSRAPVREALYLLQIDGIVERVPRKGTIVKSFTKKDIEDYLTTIIGILQLGIELSKEYWTDGHREEFKQLFEEAEKEFKNLHIIDYQYKAESLFRYIIYFTDNKALIKYYEDANHVLNVFAQVQMSRETMKDFHVKISEFVAAMQDSEFTKAKELVHEAIKEGAK